MFLMLLATYTTQASVWSFISNEQSPRNNFYLFSVSRVVQKMTTYTSNIALDGGYPSLVLTPTSYRSLLLDNVLFLHYGSDFLDSSDSDF